MAGRRGGPLPDPRGPAFPGAAAPTFLELSGRPLPGPALALASDDDPYADAAASAEPAAGRRAPGYSVGGHGRLFPRAASVTGPSAGSSSSP